uniref:Uncharacterized protein n=1 Tax=Caenorhabditis japonica TaxID=281687 RepID=A0A8R1E9P7_CAEJA
MISTGPAQVQHYALVLSAKREAWLLLAAQHNAAAVSTISARHQHKMPLPGFNKTVPQSDIFTTPTYRSELKTDGNDHEIRPAAHGTSDECKPCCSSARCRPISTSCGAKRTVPQTDIFMTPTYRSELNTDGNDHEIRPAAHGTSDE